MTKEMVFLSQHKYLGSKGEGDTSHPFLHKLVSGVNMNQITHLGAAMLCSQARQEGVQTRFVNLTDLYYSPEKVRELIQYVRGDDVLICLSSMDINSDFVHGLATQLPPERTIVGGYGPTYAPDLFDGKYPLAFGRMEGEGFSTILSDYKNDKPLEMAYLGKIQGYSDRVQDYPELDPRYSALLQPEWLKPFFQTIEIIQGCHNSCEFCHTGIDHKKIEAKPLHIVEAQLKMLAEHLGQRRRVALIVDQNLMSVLTLEGGRQYLIDLMALFKKFNFYWAGEGTIGDIVEQHDYELLDKIAERCLSFLVGAENLLGSVRGSVSKNWLNKNFAETVQILARHKVPVMWSIIGGLDNQSFDYYQKVVEVVNRLGLSVIIHKAVARPGTPYYDKVKSEGRIVSDESIKRNMKFHTAHRPVNMTEDDVLGGHTYAHLEIFSLPNTIRRFRKNLAANGVAYAAKCAVPDLYGMGVAMRLQKMYEDECNKYRNKISPP